MTTKDKYFSYHIFYFPFRWNVEGGNEMNLSEQIDMNRIRFRETGGWQRTTSTSGVDAVNLYNEKNYYYQFVHKVLYDDGSEESLIRHFEIMESQK